MPQAFTQTGDTEPIEVLALNLSKQALTGLSNLKVRIRRRSDEKWFDWTDDTFKIAGSVLQMKQALAEVSPVHDPGKYKLNSPNHVNGFDTSKITNPVDPDFYFVTVEQDGAPQNAANIPQIGELYVGGFIDYLDGFVSANASPAEVNAELVALGLDHLVAVNPGAAPPATNTYIKQLLDRLSEKPSHVVMQTFSYNKALDKLVGLVWIEHKNLVFNTLLNMGLCTVDFYSESGILLFSMTAATPDAQGFYKVEKLTPGFVSDKAYYTKASIPLSGVGTVSGGKGMFTL